MVKNTSHSHRRKDDKMTPLSLAKMIGVAIGLIGGTITIGDRLWADKATVAGIEQKVESIDKKTDFMYRAFLEAAKHAGH